MLANLVVLGREDSFTITIEDGIFIFLDDEEIVFVAFFPPNDADFLVVCGQNLPAV